MPHQDFTDLIKEQKRNLSNLRDGFISEKGHSTLVARYGQKIVVKEEKNKILCL